MIQIANEILAILIFVFHKLTGNRRAIVEQQRRLYFFLVETVNSKHERGDCVSEIRLWCTPCCYQMNVRLCSFLLKHALVMIEADFHSNTHAINVKYYWSRILQIFRYVDVS